MGHSVYHLGTYMSARLSSQKRNWGFWPSGGWRTHRLRRWRRESTGKTESSGGRSLWKFEASNTNSVIKTSISREDTTKSFGRTVRARLRWKRDKKKKKSRCIIMPWNIITRCHLARRVANTITTELTGSSCSSGVRTSIERTFMYYEAGIKGQGPSTQSVNRKRRHISRVHSRSFHTPSSSFHNQINLLVNRLTRMFSLSTPNAMQTSSSIITP